MIFQFAALKNGEEIPPQNQMVKQADLATRQHAKLHQVERPKTQYADFPIPSYDRMEAEEMYDDAYLSGEIKAVSVSGTQLLGTQQSGMIKT